MVATARQFLVFIVLMAAMSLAMIAAQTRPANAQTECFENCNPNPSPSPTPSPSPSITPSPTPTPNPSDPPAPTDGGSSGQSINGLAGQRFNQMITNQVLGSVLLGVNEQINCSDCISAFGSVGSFMAGIHGRKELTNNLSLLAGLAYTQYSENGYHVTSAPIGALVT